jgi:hypothetical protein
MQAPRRNQGSLDPRDFNDDGKALSEAVWTLPAVARKKAFGLNCIFLFKTEL